MDPAAEGTFLGRTWRCHACAEQERALDKFPPEQRAGLYVSLERRY